jgi:hypothetical protein
MWSLGATRMGRRLLLAIALLLLVTFLVRSQRKSSHITFESFEQIQEGMTLKEVEFIFQAPAGDYRTGPTTTPIDSRTRLPDWDGPGMWPPEDLPVYTWKSDDAIVNLSFDRRGLVLTKAYARIYRIKVGPLKELVWRFRQFYAEQ